MYSSQQGGAHPNICWQHTVGLCERNRGFHLVTEELLTASVKQQIAKVRTGLATFFLPHTSASLCISESGEGGIRRDMERIFDRLAPEAGAKGLENSPTAIDWEHKTDGPYDMSAHVKAALLGVSVAVPVVNGKLALGPTQGIWLGEHRRTGCRRKCMIIVQGEPMAGGLHAYMPRVPSSGNVKQAAK